MTDSVAHAYMPRGQRRWLARLNRSKKMVSLTRRRKRTLVATFVSCLFWYMLTNPVGVQPRNAIFRSHGEDIRKLDCIPNVPVFVVGLEDTSLHKTQSFFQGDCVRFVQAVNSSYVILSEMKSMGTIDSKVDDKLPNRLKNFGIALGPEQDSFTVSCSLSHRRVWEYIVQKGIKRAIILEEDAKPTSSATLARPLFHRVSFEWDYVNLGRCWDYCEFDKDMFSFGSKHRVVRSVNPMCTHAYAITQHGAKVMLKYSLPHFTSVDALVAVLGRAALLKLYSISPPLWSQERVSITASHDTSELVECDKTTTQQFRILRNDRSKQVMNSFFYQERQLLERSSNHWIRGWIDEQSSFSLANRTDWDERLPQCLDHKQCSQIKPTQAHTSDVLTKLGIDSVIIWGLRVDKTSHTHAFVHFALAKALKVKLGKSDRARSLCWFEIGDFPRGCSVRNALIFLSPKHSGWTSDASFEQLPVHPTNYYVTHDLVPPKIKWLHASGRVITWTTWGPDGNFPLIDSKEYWLLKKSMNIMKSCDGFVCGSIRERMLVSAWGTGFSSSEIEQAITNIPRLWQQRRTSRQLYFVGSIWHGNSRFLKQFMQGCGNEVTVLPSYTERCHGLFHFTKRNCVKRKYVDDRELRSRTATSLFTPAVQGGVHLNGNFGYIPDRVLNGAAFGQVIATNNPAVVKLLADHPESVVYRENVSELCQAAAAYVRLGIQEPSHAVKLARFIQRDHTYEQRLSALLELFLQLSSQRRVQ